MGLLDDQDALKKTKHIGEIWRIGVCGECKALVLPDDGPAHEVWHQQLSEQIERETLGRMRAHGRV